MEYKKAVAAACLWLLTDIAYGQSSIVLYGRLDVAVAYDSFSNTGTVRGKSAESLLSDISYWGLRGAQDLGGGTKVIFKLESWFNVANGAVFNPNSFFSRESYVGVSNADYGTLQMGSQFPPSLWLSVPVDPFGRATNGALFSLFQQMPGRTGNARGSLSTLSNAIQYITPRIGGFLGRFVYTPSGRADAPTNLGNTVAVGLSYQGMRYYIGAVYESQRQTGTTLGLPGASLPSTTWLLGGTYDLGYFKVHAEVMRNQVAHFGNVEGWMTGVTYPAFHGAFRGSYATRWTQGMGGTRAAQSAVGYIYPLSKRTSVYANFAHLSNGQSISFGLWPGSAEVYNAQKLPTNGQGQNEFELGLRHDF